MDLRVRERTAEPVGARRALVQRHARGPLDRVLQRGGRALAHEAGGALRVEHVLRQVACGPREDLQVLQRVVQHDLRVRVRQKLTQRHQIVTRQRNRVHKVHIVPAEADLDHTERGVVRALPHKLGVERDGVLLAGAGAKVGEGRGRIDHEGRQVQPPRSHHSTPRCASGARGRCGPFARGSALL